MTSPTHSGWHGSRAATTGPAATGALCSPPSRRRWWPCAPSCRSGDEVRCSAAHLLLTFPCHGAVVWLQAHSFENNNLSAACNSALHLAVLRGPAFTLVHATFSVGSAQLCISVGYFMMLHVSTNHLIGVLHNHIQDQWCSRHCLPTVQSGEQQEPHRRRRHGRRRSSGDSRRSTDSRPPGGAMPAGDAETDETQYSTDDAAAARAGSGRHIDDEHSAKGDHEHEDGRHEQARFCTISRRALLYPHCPANCTRW